MKSIASIFVLCMLGGGAAVVASTTPAAAVLTGTHGSNLTTYNGASGLMNNNEYNSLMNNRTSAGAPAKADFGNCNSLILRCASPKCANGGCTTMDVATPIVAGCVSSNASCKQYGDDLIQSIAAQLVANSNAKTTAQMAAAQAQAQAASDAAAQQSAAQLQQMQSQMQQQMAQMQQEMAAQNAQQVQALQDALEAQKELTAAAVASAQTTTATTTVAQPATTASATEPTMPTTTVGALTQAQAMAANAGVSADVLAREQIAGQILSDLEKTQTALNNAKSAMQDAFKYAGCDDRGDNCTGPKRVSVFRQKALAFFDPYDAVLRELLEALELAQSVGVDISDIYMLLNDSCNTWAQYLCNGGKDNDGNWAKYDNDSCPSPGGKSARHGFSRGTNQECYPGQTIPPEDSTACTMNRQLTDMEEVQRNFLYAGSGDIDENIRVGCMSSVLQNSKLFSRLKSNGSKLIDIETLQRIISQDAPSYSGGNKYSRGSDDADTNKLKYCALTPNGYMELERAVSTKKLPSRICVKDETLTHTWKSDGAISVSASESILGRSNNGASLAGYNKYTCDEMNCHWDTDKKLCTKPDGMYINDNGQCVNGSFQLKEIVENATTSAAASASTSSTSGGGLVPI
ncbi:hypothetical protein HDR66_01440 [bacterium]|nr:hypothetical protein [bacterium]